jgi:hypothetical protein
MPLQPTWTPPFSPHSQGSFCRDTFEQRAARGKAEDLAEILANVPDAPLAPGDERE